MIPHLNVHWRVEWVVVVDLLDLSCRGRDKEGPLQLLDFFCIELPLLVNLRAVLVVRNVLKW